MKKIFIISPVTLATKEIRTELDNYTKELEDLGNDVHLPHRDTDQTHDLLEICLENIEAMKWADEIHVFYMENSKGIHFDIGASLALQKPMLLVKNYDKGKSNTKNFLKLLYKWEDVDFKKPNKRINWPTGETAGWGGNPNIV